MYCPKCGQQQVSDDMRFCSRCGLPIGEVSQWLVGGGVLAVMREAEPLVVSASPRRKGIIRGAKLMFLSAVLMPIFLSLSFLIDEPVPLFVPFTIFLAGLSVMLYASLFAEDTPPVKGQAVHGSRLGTTFGNTALPPASNLPMNVVSGQRVRTAELVQPPSVTEHTTRLLDHD